MPLEAGFEVTVGPQGRVVVPAPLRRRLGIEPGDVLVARAEDDRLVLERRAAILERIRRRLAVVPADVSMVDELIAERRAEAEREQPT
jgi:AbrB family looped-hinge helix DNA binding protein